MGTTGKRSHTKIKAETSTAQKPNNQTQTKKTKNKRTRGARASERASEPGRKKTQQAQRSPTRPPPAPPPSYSTRMPFHHISAMNAANIASDPSVVETVTSWK